MSTATTKQAILGRVRRRPEFAVVPEHAIKLFDRVVEQRETEALRLYPDDMWERVQYWKEAVLDVTLPSLRGVIAGYYHEYIAALMRNDVLDIEADDQFGFNDRLYNPHAELVAQRDAYLACTASLR
jgi:hypothetical protein